MARATRPVQDALDLGLPEPAPRVQRTKAPPSKGYVRQERTQNPALCLLCIDEMYETKTRKQAAPHRVTHRVWIPSMDKPVLMCAEHAQDFATRHGLGRANHGRGSR